MGLCVSVRCMRHACAQASQCVSCCLSFQSGCSQFPQVDPTNNRNEQLWEAKRPGSGTRIVARKVTSKRKHPFLVSAVGNIALPQISRAYAARLCTPIASQPISRFTLAWIRCKRRRGLWNGLTRIPTSEN